MKHTHGIVLVFGKFQICAWIYFFEFYKKEIYFRKLGFFHREFEWDGSLLRGGGLPFLGVDSWLAAASNVPPGWTKCFLESLYLHIL